MSSLSPLDLLSLTDEEQAIIRCLSQRPELTLAEIAETTALSVAQLEPVIQRMVSEARVVERLVGGQRLFSVRFVHGRKRARNAASPLLELFNESLGSFLAQATLSNVLSDTERNELASLATERTLLPGEVCSWQSNALDQVGLVRVGLLKSSRVQGGQQADKTTGYIHRGEWFGISEMLSMFPTTDTYSAVIKTELLCWSASTLLEFIGRHAHFSLAINRWISQKLHQYRDGHGRGHLWVVEGVNAQAGATMLATNLATLAVQGEQENGQGERSVVLLWDMQDYRSLMMGNRQVNVLESIEQLIEQHASGFAVLHGIVYSDYPPHVQLDVALAYLQARYTHIICDTGTHASDDLLVRLRGRAHTLISVTRDAERAIAVAQRWDASRPYANPSQKRMAVLNRLTVLQQSTDPIFHMVLPDDPEAQAQAKTLGQVVVQAAPESPLSQALHEVYRRLSLTHTIGVFIPSTMNVDEPIDSGQQVQEALAFLGSTFGGATRTAGEGVWRSEESGLVVEQVTIVRSFVSEQTLQQKLDEVITFVRGLKQTMQQEAMAVDVDNQLLLV